MNYGFYEELEALPDDKYDDGFTFLENIPVGESYDLSDFLHGRCDEFAAAVSDYFGYAIEAVWGADGRLIHAFCVAEVDGQEYLIDARGMTDDAGLFWDEFGDWCTLDDDGCLYDRCGECDVRRYEDAREMLGDRYRMPNQDEDLYQFLNEYEDYFDVARLCREEKVMDDNKKYNGDEMAEHPEFIDRLREALVYFGEDAEEALGDPLVMQHGDAIVSAYEHGVDGLVLDDWMAFERLLGEKMDYDEFQYVKRLYVRDPVEDWVKLKDGEGVERAAWWREVLLSYRSLDGWSKVRAKYPEYREDMIPDEERAYVDDLFGLYEKEGFAAFYWCSDGEFEDRVGQSFKVIGRASAEEFDLASLPMWEIEFEDGTRAYAYAEEIVPSEMKNAGCKLFDEGLVVDEVVNKAKATTVSNDIIQGKGDDGCHCRA